MYVLELLELLEKKLLEKKAFITAIEDNKIVLLKLDDILFCVDKTSIIARMCWI